MQSGTTLDGVLCCDQNSRALDFGNILHACWVAIVTMVTVGYGEKYPKTLQGCIVGVVCMFSGILLIALPTAIVGQNFQEVYLNVLDQQKTSVKRTKALTKGSVSAMKKEVRRNSAAKSSGNPQAVSWKRIQIISSSWLFIRRRWGGPGQAGRPNSGGLVLGCIDADLCKEILNIR